MCLFRLNNVNQSNNCFPSSYASVPLPTSNLHSLTVSFCLHFGPPINSAAQLSVLLLMDCYASWICQSRLCRSNKPCSLASSIMQCDRSYRNITRASRSSHVRFKNHTRRRGFRGSKRDKKIFSTLLHHHYHVYINQD